ncbi:MAG TPA: hypothetical protein VGR43_02515, partial [Dehalococcoidia bacterium]|nr:hypothetical protein [Dehalococcoidia bacterium]
VAARRYSLVTNEVLIGLVVLCLSVVLALVVGFWRGASWGTGIFIGGAALALLFPWYLLLP